jgi:4-hydroxybenzoate polyprenyltransferase
LPSTAKLLYTVSRPEFIPANSASLVIGLAWSLTLPADLLWGLFVPLVLAYAVITFVAAYAAQINSLSDYDLDVRDGTKKGLVQAMSQLKRSTLRTFMALELAVSLGLLLILVWIQAKPFLLLFWAVGVFLAHSYSAPPIRLKSRGVLAVITLLLVLSVLPVTFIAYVFTTTLSYAFFLFLFGQALTVYGVIVPAEIRDYFGDKKNSIVTFTVQLGLTKASLLGITLLGVGGILAGVGLAAVFAFGKLPWLMGFLIAMAIAYLHILRKYWRLYVLSRMHAAASAAEKEGELEEGIVKLAAENPRWITLITQVIVLMCIVLLISKIV